MEFQAKDIQRILKIPKHRYEYLAAKIGITPEIEEAEGQGKIHRYSFKNLLQFAFIHAANLLGLTPKASRDLLNHLDAIDSEPKIKFGIYDPDSTVDISVHFVIGENNKYFTTTWAPPHEDRIIMTPHFDNKIFFPGEKATFLFETIGFLTINIQTLKAQILKRIGK
jgi:hypothetical protein